MENMYDKLGDMLNDVLESGKIPEAKKKKEEEQPIKADLLENLPLETKNAFIFMECTPEMTSEEVRKVYHEKLKTIHPDKNTIQDSQSDNKNTHYTVQNLNLNYKILQKYYTKN